jgi:hypothetical protein
MDGFKRSSRFGIVGVIVLAAAIAAIALTLGSGEAKPKTALALIFGLLAASLVSLFTLQRRDLAAVAAGAAGTAHEGEEIANPTMMREADLWAALAVKPIGQEAIEARSAGWESGRRSIRLGMMVTALILIGVVPIYLFDTFSPS